MTTERSWEEGQVAGGRGGAWLNMEACLLRGLLGGGPLQILRAWNKNINHCHRFLVDVCLPECQLLLGTAPICKY